MAPRRKPAPPKKTSFRLSARLRALFRRFPLGPRDDQPGRTLVFLISLVLLFILSLGFLMNSSGFLGWAWLDANLLTFVLVNINILLLTAVFYLLLRNLFKLFYERKAPLAAVGLKTKLIIAFVALSLPSTAFHLATGTVMATLFEKWSRGEYRQVTSSARVVIDEMNRRELADLEREGALIAARLPQDLSGYTGDWKAGVDVSRLAAVRVYGPDKRLAARWVSGRLNRMGFPPVPSDYFLKEEGLAWEDFGELGPVYRLILPLGNKPGHLWLELARLADPPIVQALSKLDYREDRARFLRQDLFLMALIILIVMALLIVFAATWIAFYLARGFVTPVEKLADATRRVAMGELGWQVRVRELGPMQGDFEPLAASFNSMSSRLRIQQTQLLQTAEDLRESHREIREHSLFVELLLENIALGVLALDHRGRITTVNQAAMNILGLPREKLSGRPFSEALDSTVASRLGTLIDRLREGARGRLSANLTLSRGGEPLHVEITLLPLHQEGEPKGKAAKKREGMVAMLENVTDLQQSQRAEAWREVAKRVAHEIKNPLTPIQLSAQRIRRKYLEGLGADGEVLDQCTQTIVDEVTSLKQMVNEFSQFAKLPERTPKTDNLNRVVEEVGRLYANGLPEGVVLSVNLDPAVPDMALDSSQLKRVFTNLVDNAAAALTKGGTISLSTRLLSAPPRVLAEVADNGPGLPSQVLARLFEPYTSTKQGGTGLGLTIANQIVLDHNGKLHYVENKPRGARFTLELPVE
ncbi:MAG: ATP-binding protein [Deltaproteobacteria bacterium]|nr:ATP-binding protein [Deltaproteobacteria bacterium]